LRSTRVCGPDDPAISAANKKAVLLDRHTGPVTRKQTDQQRLDALIDRKIDAMERSEQPPSLADLNSARRLLEWRATERAVREAREWAANAPGARLDEAETE
jgi:hypothetical protein